MTNQRGLLKKAPSFNFILISLKTAMLADEDSQKPGFGSHNHGEELFATPFKTSTCD
jgi:hypothetical protein